MPVRGRDVFGLVVVVVLLVTGFLLMVLLEPAIVPLLALRRRDGYEPDTCESPIETRDAMPDISMLCDSY